MTDQSGQQEVLEVADIETPNLGDFVYRFRETMRGALALGLLVLLLLEILLGLWFVSSIAQGPKPENAKIVTDWLASVITGTIALLGAATGFYYGTKS